MKIFLPRHSLIGYITILLVIGLSINSNAQFSHYNIPTKGDYQPPHITAGCTPDSVIFNYTGAAVAFTVPACVTSITVRAWGGGGGGAGADSFLGLPGGGGAYASSTIAVAPGQVFSVVVGGGGALGGSHAASTGAGAGGFGLGDGGSGGDPGSSGTSGAGGGGGGGSGLVSGGAIVFDAAGGGGGGGGGNHSQGGAGGGGGVAGSDGTSSSSGSESVGGATGGSPDSVGTQGSNRGVGNDGGAGGGGGGGDNAGAGGGAPGCDCGGAGGGGGTSLGGTVINGSGQTVGNSGYATLPAGTGAGGGASAAGGVAGGNGYLVISYCVAGAITLSTTQQNLTCFNSNNGDAVAHVVTGTGPFTYSWNTTPVQTNDSAFGVPAGTYTVTVNNGGTCPATATVTLTQPGQLRDSIVNFTNVSVACGANGTATVGVAGGSPGYTYSWNTAPVQTNAQATNLAAGNYTVTVTDKNLCTNTATVAIAQPGALTASIASTTNASCNGAGGNTGTATASVTGGTGPYLYSWNTAPVQTNITATNLGAGSYTVSVTDANNCTVTAVATIIQPGAIRDSIAKTIEVLCNGQTNGSAIDGVKGGSGPYTYSWNTAPVQTTSTASALGVGSYTVVVTDAGGCKDSTIATITQPTVLTLTASPFAATCNGLCNGSATVIPKGGTAPYTYLWSNATSGTTANVTGLCAGNYSVTVTDANGCLHDTTNLVVIQPAAITLTKTVPVSAFCNQADGGDSVTIAGGTAPYVYAWSNGQTATNLVNVKPGSYCFGVQDANKCQDSICVIIPNTPGATASITATVPVTCNGGANGTATGTAAGGSGNYTYSWTTAPAQTTPTATGLSAAVYTLTVTDVTTGCQSTANATITQPALVVTTAVTPATICVGSSGNLTATSVGGAAPYTYTWNTGCTATTGGPSCSVSPIVTTTYSVTTVDANNCPGAQVTEVVTVNPPLSVTTSKPVAICPGLSATVTANPKGGDGTYFYNWLPGPGSTQSISVSPATTVYYTVVVSDGCNSPDATDSVQVIVNPLPVVAFSSDTVSGCYPTCVTFVDASTIASGSLKSWTWTFGDNNTFTGTGTDDTGKNCYKSFGVYTVTETVTSDSNCPSSLTKNNMITVYDHPHTQFTSSPQPTTIASPNINFTDKTTDIYGLTQWFWNLGDTVSGQPNFAITQNAAHTYMDTGTYCVKLIDINKHSCIDSITNCIYISALYTLYIPDAFTPNADGVNDVFIPKGTYFSSFEMYIFDRWGTPIYHTNDMNKGWNGSVNNDGHMCQQDTYVYLVNVTDFRGTDYSYLGKVSLVK